MPFSSELGMNVYDPLAAYQSGQPAAAMAGRAFEAVQDRALEERKLKMVEDENRRKASATLLRNEGMRELTDLVDQMVKTDPSIPPELAYRKAFFKVAPKLFADNPQAPEILSTMAHQEATEKAQLGQYAATLQHYKTMENIAAGKAAVPKTSSAYRQAMDQAVLEAGGDPGSTVLQPGGPAPILQPRPQAAPVEPIPGMPAPQAAPAPMATPTPMATPAAPDVDLRRRALEIMQSKQNKETSPEKEREDFVKLTRDQKILAALAKGNPDDIRVKQLLADTNAALEAFGLQHKGGLTATLQYDDQGRPIINLGEGKATVGTQTAIQTELANLKNSVIQTDQAKNVLTEKDLGVPGGFWNTIVNRWVAQVVPEAADPSVSANRAQLQKAVDSYLQTQQQRGRLSAGERAEVRKTLITQGLGESLPTARKVLETMSRMQKFEAIGRAKTGQQPLQDWMFTDLTQTDIRQLYREGIITQPEFFQWASKAKAR